MKKKNTNPGNVASWKNTEAKKKSLADGRKRAYEARREAGLNSFPDHQIKAISLAKYRQHGNHLALFLIENGLETKSLLERSRSLNTPYHFSTQVSLEREIEKFVLEAEGVATGVLAYDVALALVTKTLEEKAKMFPKQIAAKRAREQRKEKDRALREAKAKANKDLKDNTTNESV